MFNFDNVTSILLWLGIFILCFGRRTFPILLIGGIVIAALVWGTPRVWFGAFYVVASVVGTVVTLRTSEVTKKTRSYRDYEVGTITSGGAPDEVHQDGNGVWSRV